MMERHGVVFKQIFAYSELAGFKQALHAVLPCMTNAAEAEAEPATTCSGHICRAVCVQSLKGLCGTRSTMFVTTRKTEGR